MARNVCLETDGGYFVINGNAENYQEWIMKLLFIALLALAAIFANSACSTIHGAGEDVKYVGQGVENASGR